MNNIPVNKFVSNKVIENELYTCIQSSEELLQGDTVEDIVITSSVSLECPDDEMANKYFVLHQLFFDFFLSAVTEFELAKYKLANINFDTNGTVSERAEKVGLIFRQIANSSLYLNSFRYRYGNRLMDFESATGLRITCLIEEMGLVAQVIYEKNIFDAKLNHNGSVDAARECIFALASFFYRDCVSFNMQRLYNFWGMYCVYKGLVCDGKHYKEIISNDDIVEEEKQ